MSNDFIDHITGKHHAFLRKMLPELTQHVITLERVHGERYAELRELRRVYFELQNVLEKMMKREEETVFPLLKAAEHEIDERLIGLLDELKSRRAHCLQLLQHIRKATGNFSLPDDACPTHRLTFQLLQELEADLAQHIHLENRVLSPVQTVKSSGIFDLHLS